LSEIALPAFGGLGTGTAAFLWWRLRLRWPAEWPLNKPWISSIAWGLVAGFVVMGAWAPVGYGLWRQDVRAGHDRAAMQALTDRLPADTQATLQHAERFDSAYLFLWADEASPQQNAAVRLGADRWVEWTVASPVAPSDLIGTE